MEWLQVTIETQVELLSIVDLITHIIIEDINQKEKKKPKQSIW